MEHDDDAKLILLGDAGVGKSSLLQRWVDDRFGEPERIDVKSKTIEVQGVRIRLRIWDTAGQERFRTVTSSYYRNARGLILVFDLGDRLSFVGLESWAREIALQANGAAVLLVGNKTDLPRAIDFGEAQTWARSNKYLYVETSAKLGTNVDQAFLTLASQVHSRKQQKFRSSSLLARQPKRRCQV